MIGAVAEAVTVPLIASGGAGALEHFAPAVDAGADAVLAASVFHFGALRIRDVKGAVAAAGHPVRSATGGTLEGRDVDHGQADHGERGHSGLAGGPRKTGERFERMSSVTDQSDQVTLREGLRVLARAIRDEPAIFAVAVAGSALYGVMTGLAAVVIGRITDDVIVPAFQQGQTTTSALALAALVIIAVSTLKATGIVVRRYYAGVMQYRLQASYRRQVTRDTSDCRCPGTTSTPRACCCRTRTLTSRRAGTRSHRSRWRSGSFSCWLSPSSRWCSPTQSSPPSGCWSSRRFC